MYNPKYEAIMYIENDEFGEWMQKLYAKVQLQKFILPFTAAVNYITNNLTWIVDQLNSLVSSGSLRVSNPYRFFQFNFLFFLRHNYILILLPIQIS